MKNHRILSLTLGSAVLSAALSPLALAADNPFSIKPLSAGYQLAQADKKMDGRCGEAKDGMMAPVEKKKDGKCGEAKCGADKKKASRMLERSEKMPGKQVEAGCGAKQ